LHQSVLETVDQAMQAYLERLRAGCRVVIDLENQEVYYRSIGRGDRLGRLERRILLMLVNEPLSGADLAKKLGVWHQAIHRALKRLREKDLMGSWTGLGENLAGTQILRRFYALNPRKVSIAVPASSPTEIQLQQAEEKAQTEALQREREGIRRMRLLSPKPSTRLKALINQSQNP